MWTDLSHPLISRRRLNDISKEILPLIRSALYWMNIINQKQPGDRLRSGQKRRTKFPQPLPPFCRKTLVRANYNNFSKGITATDQYLVLFFRNLIMDENNTLSNREMHVSQSIKSASPKSQFDTLNCTLEELAVLKAVRENPHITQAELKTAIGKSIATIKRLTISLQGKGILVRKNGKRNGWWEISD